VKKNVEDLERSKVRKMSFILLKFQKLNFLHYYYPYKSLVPPPPYENEKKKNLDSDEEEEEWLFAVESGNLHKIDEELRKIK